MGWESFDVVRFELEPLLQHRTRTAKPESTLSLLILEVCNVKPTQRILWTGNLLMLTFGPRSRSNVSSLALVSCLSGGYKFASVLRCVGLVFFE